MAGIKKSITIHQRLASASMKVTSGCIEWQGFCVNNGYGVIRYEGRDQGAHRVSYTVNVGPIPNGILVCHTCDNRKCINPEHLFLGTHADNTTDMVTKDRQPHGTRHPSAKITERTALLIWHDDRKYREIATSFAISMSVVAQIKQRKAWCHVTRNLPPTRTGKATGDRHHNVKLTAEQVSIIKLDKRPHQVIADLFGCTASNISQIKNGRNWKHIP